MKQNRFIFTCGDINGIGPEIVLKALNKACSKSFDKFIFISPHNVFFETSLHIRPNFSFEVSNKFKETESQVLVIGSGKAKWEPGKPSKYSGKISFESIKLSAKLVLDGKADAIITAPASKTAFKLAGVKFPGHTEIYASICKSKNFNMLFYSKSFMAIPLTIHEPISKVSKLINKQRIKDALDNAILSLQKDFKVLNPSIAVLGLNPHAGEAGLIGSEELKIVSPVIKEYKGVVKGPFSADAFFGNKMYEKFDLVIGMYHDQVLIPFKLINFGKGVNYTAGLPIVRTSPDHGTAYDIASKYCADDSSIYEAFTAAKLIVENRKEFVAEG